jgi:hypothetical protein
VGDAEAPHDVKDVRQRQTSIRLDAVLLRGDLERLAVIVAPAEECAVVGRALVAEPHVGAGIRAHPVDAPAPGVDANLLSAALDPDLLQPIQRQVVDRRDPLPSPLQWIELETVEEDAHVPQVSL